jgi:hypothetical protein
MHHQIRVSAAQWYGLGSLTRCVRRTEVQGERERPFSLLTRFAPLPARCVDQTPEISTPKRALQHYSWGVLPSWNPLRKACIFTVSSTVFERVSVIVIVANCLILAMEDPLDDDNVSLRNRVARTMEPVFTALFSLELLLKVRWRVSDALWP